MKTESPHSLPRAFSEKVVISLLCLLAGIHVYIYSAAFPFFNNVDEQYHFDLVVRYSRGDIPKKIGKISDESLPYIAIYSTPEYFSPLSAFKNGEIPPPLWMQPEKMLPHVLRTQEHWKQLDNHEASQPPLYYSIAGLWWRLGQLCGLSDGPLLYTVRFLNVFFVMALVWVGFFAARLIFPENGFIRIGVPTLLAFFPQTAFYSINNDVLSPLAFGLAFVCLIRLMRDEVPGIRLGLATGFAITATYLVKVSSIPVIAVAAGVIVLKVWQLCRMGQLRGALPGLMALTLSAAIPIGGWLAWTKTHFGDFTGSATKIEFLGWTVKPVTEWLHHPIFTPHGCWTFVSGLMTTFWQGEFLWYGQPRTFPVANIIYTVLSVGFVGFALIKISLPPSVEHIAQRQALRLGFWSCAALLFFLALLSMVYDFHNCVYPSREHPYFTSGRLMGAALIPFLLLFVYGIDCTLSRVKSPLARPAVLTVIILFMLITEITEDWPVFSNAYNWFHM